MASIRHDHALSADDFTRARTNIGRARSSPERQHDCKFGRPYSTRSFHRPSRERKENRSLKKRPNVPLENESIIRSPKRCPPAGLGSKSPLRPIANFAAQSTPTTNTGRAEIKNPPNGINSDISTPQTQDFEICKSDILPPPAKYNGTCDIFTGEISHIGILETNPQKTKALWSWVREFNQENMPPKVSNKKGAGLAAPDDEKDTINMLQNASLSAKKQPRSRATRAGSDSKGNQLRPSASSSKSEEFQVLNSNAKYPASVSMGETETVVSVATSSVASKKSKLNAHSKEFERKIYAPRKIVIDRRNQKEFTGASAHFGTTTPSQAYKNLAIDLRVYLEFNNAELDRVAKKYSEMSSLGLCEAEFQTMGTETFFRGQQTFEPPKTRQWTVYRMMQLVNPANDETKWAPPPLLTTDQQDGYTFDVRPDCSYWISLSGFNSNYHGDIRRWLHVLHKRMTCPYLTVEFKKDDENIDQAQRQASASAAVAVYNRYLLKQAAMETDDSRTWTEKDRELMRHYVLTFTGENFDVWIMRAELKPDGDTSWDGCRMVKLCMSACDSIDGVRKLALWLNEIHRWGLGAHATGIEEDMKKILNFRDVQTTPEKRRRS